MAIRIGGLSSGIDTEALINKMVQAQRARLVDTYKQKNQAISWKQEYYRETNNKLRVLSNAINSVRNLDFQAKKVESSNTNVLTVTGGKVSGSYTINVEKIASAAYINTTPPNKDVTNNTGSDLKFTINGVEIIAKPGDGLSDIAKSINAKALETGVSASYDPNNNQLYIRSTTIGSAAKIEFGGTDADVVMGALGLDSSTKVIRGHNALVSIDGVYVDPEILTTGNKFEYNGMTVDLKQVGSATITVSSNLEPIVEKVKEFVEAYNNVMDFMSGKMGEKRYFDYAPLTDEQKAGMKEKDIELWEEKAKSGLLKNDYTYSSIYNSLRMTTMDSVSGLSADNLYTTLRSLGISTGDTAYSWANKGKLELDENKLREALESNLGKVEEFFKKDAAGNLGGFTTKLINNLSTNMNTIRDRADIAGQGWMLEIANNEKRITTGEERLNRMMERYWKQFTAMETALAKMQSQSQWLEQQLSAYSNLASGSNSN